MTYKNRMNYCARDCNEILSKLMIYKYQVNISNEYE